jgi:glucose-6-phosphate 1-dehydrogenase
MNDRNYRIFALNALQADGIAVDDQLYLSWCEACLFYQSIEDGNTNNYEHLADRIKSIEQRYHLPGNRVFYMAIPPRTLPKILLELSKMQLNQSSGWTRLIVEKPFGRDLASARQLNTLIHQHFDESQIYRIDHFLGKETVQNLLVFRFANAFFEHLWSRDHITSVEITVAETVGVEWRASYYEQSGALRDMVQNHLTQLLTIVAMETPIFFTADAIRDAKVNVLKQITPIDTKNVVLGQYT